jgi:hypothetical protein
MQRDLLIVVAITLLVGLVVWWTTRPRGDIVAPDLDAPFNFERGRRRSEAAMAAPAHDDTLTQPDRTHVEQVHAVTDEMRTGELPLVAQFPPPRRHHIYREPSQPQIERMRRRMQQPILAFEADPLAAPIPEMHHVEAPVMFGAQAAEWFSSTVPFVPPTHEPDPMPALDFTGEYRRDDLFAMLGRGEVST